MPEITRRKGSRAGKTLAPEQNHPVDDEQSLLDQLDGDDDIDLRPEDDAPVEEPAPARRSSRARTAAPAMDAPAATEPVASAPAKEDFWTAVSGRDDIFWGSHAAYLYRTRPQIVNSSKNNYIGIFQRNFDIEDVRVLHGGGGFKAILKDNGLRKQIMPDFFFEIEGEPKYIAGQRFKESGEPVPVGSAPATAPAAAPANDAAAIIRELSAALRSDKPAESALADAMKVMQQGASAGMEMMKAGLISQNNGNGNNALHDKLMAAAIENMFKPKDSLGDALVVIEKLRKLDRPERTEKENPLGEIGQLKDLFGGDTIADLVMRGLKGEGKGAGPGWQEIAAGALVKFADNLPSIIQGVKDLVSQQIQIGMMRNGAAPPRPGLPPARPVTTIPGVTAPPAGTAQPAATGPIAVEQPGAPAQPTQEEVNANLERIKMAIIQSFNEGDTGDFAAMVIMRSFPELVPALKPYFSQVDAVKAFAQSDPVLSAIAAHEEFDGFTSDFISKLQNPAWIPPDDEEDEPSPVLVKPAAKVTPQPDGPQAS